MRPATGFPAARLGVRIALLAAFLTSAAWAQCGALSWDAYREVRRTLPYVLRLGTPPGELLMFGAQHSHDPRHAQFPELERLWREFRPQIAFSEGGVRPPAPSRDDAIARYGEPGLLRFLADRDHVALESLEAPEDREAAWLAAQFPAAQVKLFYILRNFLSVSPADPRSVLELRRSALDSVARRQRLTGEPHSPKDAEALAARLLPELRDWRSLPPAWFDPSRADTFLNAIARSSTEYRNCHMIPLLAEAVRRGNRVFVVVGGSHVVMQEPALRAAIH